MPTQQPTPTTLLPGLTPPGDRPERRRSHTLRGRCCHGCLLLVAVLASPGQPAEPGQVHLEIARDARSPVESGNQWLEALRPLNLGSLRVRAARANETAQLQEVGDGPNATYRVVAILNNRGELELPAAKFRRGDQVRVGQWIGRLGTTGSPSGHAAGSRDRGQNRTNPWGLSAEQLLEVKRALRSPIAADTSAEALPQVLERVRQGSSIPWQFSPQARERIQRAGQGTANEPSVATGTAIAAVLHALGLGFAPDASAGTVQFRVDTLPRLGDAAWPVGQPTTQRPQNLAPKLFETVPVEIVDTPIGRVLEAFRPRLELPILRDDAAIAAAQIDLTTTKVSFPAGKASYDRILRRALFQARLEMELRVDERGKPFLWIRSLAREDGLRPATQEP